MKLPSLLPVVLLTCLTTLAEEPLRIPAFTAYLDPLEGGARISQRSGISGWKEPKQKVMWFGEIKTPGSLECSLAFRSPAPPKTKLRLTLAAKSREVAFADSDTNRTSLSFGTFEIAAPGYQCFKLESLNEAGEVGGEIEALVLNGPATKDAHFNLKPRRNAASVHLAYPTPAETKVEAFYCEVTAVEDPLWTFYMACGWHRGYFGMQVNSPTERRIIFSVWDSGDEAVDRGKVEADNRVSLVAKGEGVYSGDFGNEGTGGHSHLKFLWKTGEKQRFIVTAKPTDETHTIFSGYYFRPDLQKWMLISSWKAPKDGGWLKRLHSFSENFGGENGLVLRKVRYANQWMLPSGGEWTELTTASFSHDATGKADRLDRFMGVESGEFFLSHGGFVAGFTRFGEKFTRPSNEQKPAVSLKELQSLLK